MGSAQWHQDYWFKSSGGAQSFYSHTCFALLCFVVVVFVVVVIVVVVVVFIVTLSTTALQCSEDAEIKTSLLY